MQKATAEASLYYELLQETLPYLEPPKQQQIQDSIAQIKAGLGNDTEAEKSPVNESDGRKIGDEHKVQSSVGSPKAQDQLEHEHPGYMDRGGYFGKTSVVRWLEDAGEKVSHDIAGKTDLSGQSLSGEDPETSATAKDEISNAAISRPNYHNNELDIHNIGASSELFNKAELPSKHIADALLECYFRTFHIMYPIVLRSEFMTEYNGLWSGNRLPDGGQSWLAMLNMMLAIGTVGMQVMQPHQQQNKDNHLKFFVKARLLQPEAVTMTSVPTKQYFQLQVLYGAYFLVSYQINRAFLAIGAALRSAQSLGLHLIDNSQGLTDSHIEFRKRIWHTVSGLDLFVAFISGRPAAFNHDTASTGMPALVETDITLDSLQDSQAARHESLTLHVNGPTVLLHRILLDKILADVMQTLYCARTVRLSWATLQEHMVRLNSLLDDWRSQLPQFYAVDSDSIGDRTPLPEQTFLMLRYHSMRMMINRPCLCEADVLTKAMPGQSEASVKKDQEAAELCVTSAQALLRLLPSDPDIIWVFKCAPWWCILHYLVQSAAILILEIIFKAVHVEDSIEDVTADARAVLQWLSEMARTGASAKKAWTVVSKLLSLAMIKAGQDPAGLEPYMWNDTVPSTEENSSDGEGMSGIEYQNPEPNILPYMFTFTGNLPERRLERGDMVYSIVLPVYDEFYSHGLLSNRPWQITHDQEST